LPRRVRRAVGSRYRRLVPARVTVPAPPPPAAPEPPAKPKVGPPVGVVEEFTRHRITGWVAVHRDADPVQVSLYLNSLKVASTWPTGRGPPAETDEDERRSWGEIRPFQFRIKDVWDYARTDGRLSLRIGHRPLPIYGHGTYLAPKRNGTHRMSELRAL